MTMTNAAMNYTLSHLDYAMVRMPFFPLSTWLAYARPAAGRARNREDIGALFKERVVRARELFGDPVVADAIFLASPSLFQRLDAWTWDIKGPEDEKMLLAFERYLKRMAFRCTPFGMFSTVGITRLGQAGAQPAPRKVRHALRIDCEALNAVAAFAHAVHEPTLRYSTNPSIYTVGERLRFTEWSIKPNRDRAFKLSEISHHEVLEQVLDVARAPARTMDELVAVFTQRNPDLAVEFDVPSLVQDLVRAKVLVPSVMLDTLTPDVGQQLLSELAQLPVMDEMHGKLADLLARVQAQPTTQRADSLAALDKEIRDLTGARMKGAALQADSFHEGDALAVDGATIDAIMASLSQLLERFSSRNSVLDTFCARFTERYGQGTIPLQEALDEEAGIGYDVQPLNNPLLRKLGLNRPTAAGPGAELSHFDRAIVSLVAKNPALMQAEEIVLDPDQLPPARREGQRGEASPFHAVMHIPLANSVLPGEQVAFVGGVFMRGAVSWWARFAYGNEQLMKVMGDYVAEIEAQSPDEVHAEVSFFPNGHAANVLTRHQHWRHRINVVDSSATPDEFTLPLSDLLLRVDKRKIELWSKRLNKRVRPYITSAHNLNMPANHVAYKFLGALQRYGQWQPALSWGEHFSSFDYKPRVRMGKLILSLRSWRLPEASLAPVAGAPARSRAEALLALLQGLGVPRFFELVERDNTLIHDQDDPIDMEQLARHAARRKHLELREILDAFDEHGHVDGLSFRRAELVVPFVPKRVQPALPGPPAQAPLHGRDLVKVPLAEVVYFKIYAGHEALDNDVLPLVLEINAALAEAGLSRHFFFVRYAVGGWHLRLRYFPTPGRHAELIAHVGALLEQGQASGLFERFELAQYERELFRYGSSELMRASEMLFHIDSRLCLALLHGGTFTEVIPARWKIVAQCIDALLNDFGMTLPHKSRLMKGLAEAFRAEHAINKVQTIQLGDEFRQHGRELLSILRGQPDMPTWAKQVHAQLATATPARRTQAQALVRLAPQAGLRQDQLLLSHIHMLCNRMFYAEGRAHEMVTYDFLSRTYHSMEAMARAESKSAFTAPQT